MHALGFVLFVAAATAVTTTAATLNAQQGRAASAARPLAAAGNTAAAVPSDEHTPFSDTAAAPAVRLQPPGAMAWVYNCGDNQTQWDELISYLNTSAKPAGLTSVSICAYRIEGDGSFGFQTAPYGPADCGQHQEAQAARIRATGLLQFPLIDCHAGIDAVRKMVATNASRAAFIAAAVKTMREQGYNGYNLDIELGGTDTDAVLYTTFVNEFSAALHAAGGALSSDVGSCGAGHRDYIGMRCAEDYRGSGIDGVATMGTYTHDFPSFESGVASGLAALGSKYVAGVDTGSDGATYFAHLTAVNISRVALWACGAAGCFSPPFLVAMAKWRDAAVTANVALE